MGNYSKKKFKSKNNNRNETIELSDNRLYTSLFFVLGILCILAAIVLSPNMGYDLDHLFMVATGRDIINNGITHINNMTWLKDLEAVYEQWLYDIISYGVYRCVGKASSVVMCIINLVVLFIPIYKLARLRNNQEKSFFISGLMFLFLFAYISPRPAILTVALLMWQFYICEAQKNMWWIPLLVLLETNVHSAYTIFHFVYLLPYIVPGITKWLQDEHDLKYLKIIPAMIAAAFCNPYGIKGALFLFYTYPSISKLSIIELQTIDFANLKLDTIMTIVICIIITVMLAFRIKKGVPSPAFYIFIGSVTMLIMIPVYKNLIFLPIGCLPIISFLFKDIKRARNYIIEVSLAIIIMIPMIFNTIPDKVNSFDDIYPSKIMEYLREVKPKRLFTAYDVGAMVEFAGMKCFVDNRPELYIKSINDKYDYINDHDKVIFGTDVDRTRIAEKYKFDYYLVNENLIEYFRSWANKKCELIIEDKNLFLYKYK